jgi:hypothetical protein
MMSNEYKRLTKKQAAYWISEAWGQHIPEKNVRTRGDWMFVYSAEYDEVDCIYQPCGGDLSGESWDSIPWGKSPFAIKDKDKVAELIDDLNKSAKVGPYEVIDYDLCLLAVSGDCADGSMDRSMDKVVYLPFREEHLSIVSDYLRASLELELQCWVSVISERYELLRQRQASCEKLLLQAGIFHDKYHVRTNWILWELSENYPINLKHKAKPEFNKNLDDKAIQNSDLWDRIIDRANE